MIDNFFLDFFLSKIEQKVRFQTDFQGKPNVTELQFSQNVMDYMLGTAYCCIQFRSTTEQNVRCKADFQEKTLIIERQFLQNVNVFFMIDTSFFF